LLYEHAKWPTSLQISAAIQTQAISAEINMHRILFPDFAELETSAGGKDLTKLFQSPQASPHAENGVDACNESASVFSKHRIRKIGVPARLDHSTAEHGLNGTSSSKQLLNSEIELLQSTIQNKEELLTNCRQEMLELRLKIEQQSAENRSLKNQVIELKEAAARAAEDHAIEIQSYLAKVLDAEEKTLQANSAIELAANVHRAAASAQRAVSGTRFENSAFKRDKDRLIHLLSLFEPAKALASQLQQIPSHYFPMPGIGSSAISSITKAQMTSHSSFVKPFILKTLTAESALWMSSKITNVVMGWGAENNVDRSIWIPLVAQLHKLWADSSKRTPELASVSRLRKSRTTASTPRDLSNMEHMEESRTLASKKCKVEKSHKISTTSDHEQIASDSSRSLSSWGKLLESGMSRLRVKSFNEREDCQMLDSKNNDHPSLSTNYAYMPSAKFEDHQIISPGDIRSFCRSEERSRGTHDFVPSELLESLKQEILLVGDGLAVKNSPALPAPSLSRTSPFEKCGELTLRNTNLRISLL
jgi:hypothetical protein